MSLLIPPEFSRKINPSSGFLSPKYAYSKKNAKGLFMSPPNIEFLGLQTFNLVTTPKFTVKYTKSTSEAVMISARFKPHKHTIAKLTKKIVFQHAADYRDNKFHSENFTVSNPIQQLQQINKNFLLDWAKNIVESPNIIIHDFYNVNPDTGSLEFAEHDYSASSYSDGTWHPEHLFTESSRNRENPYWIPMEVSFDSRPRPNQRGKGFNPRTDYRTSQKQRLRGYSKEGYEEFASSPSSESRFWEGVDGGVNSENVNEIAGFSDPSASYPYSDTSGEVKYDEYLDNPYYGPGVGPGNGYMYSEYGDGGFSKGGLFPAWQYTPQYRPYDRDNSETLREGGEGDRRVNLAQRTGYDMSALTSKSYY